MNKTLFLVRHALAEAQGSAIKDFDRHLVASGVSEASRLGKKIVERNIKIDKIISSDAARAYQTSKYICEQISFPFRSVVFSNDIYDSSVRVLLSLINKSEDEFNNIMVVGHNPGISYFAEFLIDEHLGSLPTCGMWTLEFQVDSWAEVTGGIGKLKLFECPNS